MSDKLIKERVEELADKSWEELKEIYKNNSWSEYDDSI